MLNRDGRRRPVTAIRLETSSHCQLRCPSCPTTTGEIDAGIGRGFLRPDDFRRLLEGAPRLRDIEVSNFGEIFLNPGLGDILRIAAERGVRLYADNGVNLSNVRPRMLEDVVRYGLRSMTCSIDGATQETYEKYRIRGRLDRVLDNVRVINAWKAKLGSPYPRLTWQFVLFGHNQHEAEAARAMARSLGMAFRIKLAWEGSVSPADAERSRQLTGFAARSDFVRRRRRSPVQDLCWQMWEQPQINFDGRVLGCCRNHWGDLGGNVFRDGLDQALSGERLNHTRQVLLGRAQPRTDTPCLNCEVYLAMRETGAYLSPARRRLSRLRTRVRSWMRSWSTGLKGGAD